MATASIQAEFFPDYAYSWRPYANPDNLYKQIETPEGERYFTIDPWTQRWAVLHHAAVELLKHSNGTRRLSEIMRSLSEALLTKPVAGFSSLAMELADSGLLFQSQVEHRDAGRPVYNRSEMVGLHLEITNACNMTCEHCYVSSGRKLPNEMTLDEIKKTIDMLPPFSGKRIAISGGEPAVRKDCAEILEYCVSVRGHDVDLYTNGKLFPAPLAQRIRDLNQSAPCKIRIQVSLEGATSGTNDLVRGKGSFDFALQGLDLLKGLNLHRDVTLFVCLTRFNIGEVDAIISLAERYDVSMLVFSQWQKQGNAHNTAWSTIAPTLEQWVQTGEKLIRYSNPRLTIHGNFHGDLNNNEIGRFCLDSAIFPKHVYYYNAFPRVTPEGEVFADQLWVDPDWIVGNVRDCHLEDCFETPKFQQQLQDMKARITRVPECQACEWKNLCLCGSPGHTYAEYGDMNHKDLFCESRIYWFNRYVKHQVARLYNQ
jgi:radical SAM protein with 4Fe4S-binding SPASM domain